MMTRLTTTLIRHKILVAEIKTTPTTNSDPKRIKVLSRQEIRKIENEEYLKHQNVKAFLDTISETEGGDYDLMYGGVKGKKNDKWRIKDYSTHPGPGIDGKTSASGRYQINRANWLENGIKKMGLTDFSPHTQDLIAVEGLRQSKAIEAVVAGDMSVAIGNAARTWNSLPLGKGMKNRVQGQPYKSYEHVINMYRKNGGAITKE